MTLMKLLLWMLKKQAACVSIITQGFGVGFYSSLHLKSFWYAFTITEIS